MRTNRRKLITITTPSLPYSYERIEYIKSNGSSYLDTGIYGSDTLDIEISCIIVERSSNLFFIASRTNPYLNTYSLVFASPYVYRFDYGTKLNEISPANYDYVNKITLKKLGLKVYLNNKLILELPTTKFKTPSTLLIFGVLTNGVVNIAPLNGGKIYFLRMTENGILVRDFIPVKRKSDGMIGMYDLVGRKFYTSPNGVAFTGG